MTQIDVRTDVLNAFGASPSVRDALLAYNRNLFDHSALTSPVRLPLPDDPFVAAWETYEKAAQKSGAFNCLKSTRIVIARRLSTIQQCDRILLIQDGKIAQEGTYEELIAKPGLFADLVYHQQLHPPNQHPVRQLAIR
jgi:hypothetical protein